MPTPTDSTGAAAPLVDVAASATVVRSDVVFEGRVWTVKREVVDLPTGQVVRDFVSHPGAVAVIALDDLERVLLIRQYRHPIGMSEWELPAGLLDVPGEPPLACAIRELHEEGDLEAQTWHHLISYASSPGGLDERMHVYIARDLSEVPPHQRHRRTDEEADILTRWVPLAELRSAVLDGALANAAVIIGTLALDAAREDGYHRLTPATRS